MECCMKRYNIKLTVKDVHCYLCVMSLMLFVPLLVAKLMNNVAGLNPIVVDSFDKGDYLVYNFDKYHTYIASSGRENIRLFGSFYERRKATYEEREKIFESLRKSLIF